MAELQDIRSVLASYRPELHSIPGVVGVAITHSTITGFGFGHQILLDLESKAAVGAIPPSVEGIDVAFLVTGRFYALTEGCHTSTPCFGKKYRPVQGGASVENSSRIFPAKNRPLTGTISGFPTETSSGRKVLLSNNHVIALRHVAWNVGARGDVISQPSFLDGGGTDADHVATLEKWVQIQQSGNKVDAAYALVNDGMQMNDTNLCGYTPGPTVEPAIGTSIGKAGRSTGCTTGAITAIDASVGVDYERPDGSYATAYFIDQIQSDIPLEAGDSGSLAVTDRNNAVGLLFAGGGGGAIANKMTNVEQLLGISFGAQQECPQLGCGVDFK